jgi:GAF domain-containing protein
MLIGDGVSGWVIANRQEIDNSEPTLDHGGSAHGMATLDYALSVPLITRESLVGTVTLYSATPFPESQSRLVQVIAPHLAQAIWSASRGDAALRSGNRTPADLRLVSIR